MGALFRGLEAREVAADSVYTLECLHIRTTRREDDASKEGISFTMFLSRQTIYTENRYKHEAMVNGEPVLFEILDTCPKVIKKVKSFESFIN